MINGSCNTTIDPSSSYVEIQRSETLWGLLLNAGYITAKRQRRAHFGYYFVTMPNRETKELFRRLIAFYFDDDLDLFNVLFSYLANGDVDQFIEMYRRLLMSFSVSYDLHKNAYQVLLLGMWMSLQDRYNVRFNVRGYIESTDIVLEAKQPEDVNVVMMLEYGEDIPLLVKEVMEEIQQSKYRDNLKSKVFLLGAAHNDRDCCIEYETIEVGNDSGSADMTSLSWD